MPDTRPREVEITAHIYAHSLTGQPFEMWEPLGAHLAAVGSTAACFAEPFGWGPAARAAGLLHDIGKASAAFQAYIAGENRARVDHSTAGAVEAVRLYGIAGRLLAFAIAGHHAGLADGAELGRRLAAAQGAIPAYDRWRGCIEAPAARDLAGCRRLKPGEPKGFEAAFLTRMLFSCLVDADFLETEAFYARAEGAVSVRGDFAAISDLAARLRAHLRRFEGASPTPVNTLRARVLAHVVEQAALPPGAFTLTVPTGGGKTLSSLAFALEHARRHELRRVIYVIPYTSIIEQTAQVFRDALGERDVLEHHASFDWEAALPNGADPSGADTVQGSEGLARLRRAAENWNAPVIVTTAVQFFESLFANRTSRCRKLHNIARSVIVLDEAQTLPLPLLHPCLAALDELTRNYGASVVLCTATQPALRRQDKFKLGLNIPEERELAPDPPSLHAALRRVRVERRPGKTSDTEIAARFAEVAQMLTIVDSRAHAQDLFARISHLPGACHLTTLMCPRHRRVVLDEIRGLLRDGAPVRLVATSLIEAGVDVDFPEVWRAAAGLDRIAQAAGRCNREGRLAELGRVVIFDPADRQPPHELKLPRSVGEAVLDAHPDPLAPDAVRGYFQDLYWSRGEGSFDDVKLDGESFPILRHIADRASTLDFPFESIARAFRLIEEAMEPVIIPWDEDADAILARIRVTDRPVAADLRRLQQYAVPVPRQTRAVWLARGVISPVHPALGDALLAFADRAHYDPRIGVRLSEPAQRAAESNII